jgi:hypothetical protein
MLASERTKPGRHRRGYHIDLDGTFDVTRLAVPLLERSRHRRAHRSVGERDRLRLRRRGERIAKAEEGAGAER